jgi:hypothetical protein
MVDWARSLAQKIGEADERFGPFGENLGDSQGQIDEQIISESQARHDSLDRP